MQKSKKISKETLFNVLKLVGGVLIFFFGLKIFVGDIGNDTEVDELYEGAVSVADEMDGELKDQLGLHDVAEAEQVEAVDTGKQYDGEENEYKLKFQNLCTANVSFCTKVKFNGDFSYQDKYMYLASAVYVLNFIQNHIQVGGSLKSNLRTINVNSVVGSRRGFANWTTVTLNLGSVLSYVEFMELVSHEVGHVVDLGVVQGKSDQKDALYTEFKKKVFAVDDPSLKYYKLSWQNETIRKSSAIAADFCSRYGMSDPFEDFAECHNLYLNHNAIFKAWAKNNDIMKQKYNFFANLYGGIYMFDSSSDLNKYSATSGVRPWDTTKM